MRVVLPTPGPPVKTKKFGLWIKTFSRHAEVRREFGADAVRGKLSGERNALARGAALEVADLHRGQAGEVERPRGAHGPGAGAGEEVDALALDAAADVGGVPVAV